MTKIYHITKRKEWEASVSSGSYVAESLKSDGFIHFSRADQLLQVANSFYFKQDKLVILRVDTEKLMSELKDEPPLEVPMSGVHFPHLYGELNLDAVEAVVDFPCGEDGKFELPKDLLG